MDAVKARLGSLKGLWEMFSGPRDVIAVDVGSYAVKVVLLKPEGAVLHLKAWAHLPIGAKADASPDERKTAIVNALRGFMIEKGVGVREAATSLSGNAVSSATSNFPG